MSHYNLESTIPVLERSLAVFRPHHQELRRRVSRVLLSIVACTIVAYFFAEDLAAALAKPLFEASPLVQGLVYTNLPEAFISYIKLALLFGILASFPVMLYHTWAFVAPGLKKNEKKFAIIVVFWGTLLFIGGSCFAFFAVLPKMLTYFMSYANDGLEPLPKFGKYLTFIARTILAFGLSFQIPFLMVMLGKADIVSAEYFRKKRMYSYIGIIILAFLLSAGDFMATALLCFPLFGLYEAGIFLTLLFNRKKKKKRE